MTKEVPGPPPVGVRELIRAQDRVSFVYLERCTVHRDGNAITATDEQGVIHLPAATLGTMLLGPGTRVTHQAMTLMAESGSTCVWVGERGVRYYAHGRTLTTSSRLIEAQARLVSNQSSRLRVARAMYAMRFPGEDVGQLTMQQLRGREGARVKSAYRDEAERAGVEWRRRDYDPSDFASGDGLNQALSAVYVNPGRPRGDGLIRPHPAESREPAIAACAAWQRDPCSGLVTRGFRSVARRRHGGRRRPTRLDSWRFGPRR